MKKNVSEITLSDLNKLRSNSKDSWSSQICMLGAYTHKAAVLLNSVIHWAVYSTDFRAYYARRYSSYSRDDFDPTQKSGGGILVQSNIEVVIEPLGEVCFLIHRMRGLIGRAVSAKCFEDQMKILREKTAYKLKDYWRAMAAKAQTPEEKFVLNVIDDAQSQVKASMTEPSNEAEKVTFAEYRALYEHLLNRDAVKSTKKNGNAAYQSIIGRKQADPFLISTIETIEKQIADLKSAAENEKYDIQKKCDNEVSRVRAEHSALIAEVQSRYDAEISVLRERSAQMMALMKIAAC